MSATQNQTNGTNESFRLRRQLTRVWARNFKSIRELDLELGPLTVLVGPNASGKSNVLDVLRFIRDAFEKNLDSAVADRHGIDNFKRNSPDGGTRDVEIGFEVELHRFRMQYSFVLRAYAGAYRVEREVGKFTSTVDRHAMEELEIRNGRVVKPKWLNHLRLDTSELAFPKLVHVMFTLLNNESEVIHESDIAYDDAIGSLVVIEAMRFYRLFPDTMRKPERPMNTHILDEDGKNLASVLREMSRRKSQFIAEINSCLGQIAPGVKHVVVQQSGGYLIVNVWHPSSTNSTRGAWFDLSQESDGTVRALGLLAAFYQDGFASLIGFEEPELMVHPGALPVLAEVMVEASHRSQVVVTTHSPDLIDRLPVESLRAVEMRDGCTEVGPVSKTQTDAVLNGLFSAGELHSMEGLAPRR